MTGAGPLLERMFGAGTDVLGLAIRATIVLAAALGIARAVRRGPARTRHALWTATFVVLLALPGAATWAPDWKLAVLPTAPPSDAEAATPAPIDTRAEMRDATASRSAFESRARGTGQGTRPTLAEGAAFAKGASLAPVLWCLWGLGAGLGIISLVVGHLRFRRLAATGRPVHDPVWLGRIDRLRARLGIGRSVRLVIHDEATTPMTGGLLDPVVVLPGSAGSWTPERREVVLTHELIHVRRRDALRQALGRAALALYWFHPLGWAAARRAAMSREQSCDEEVLALGIRPSEYASVLVDLAGDARAAPSTLAIPIIQPSDLERRVMFILDPDRPRRSVLASAATLLFLGLVGIPAAIAQPVPAPPPRPRAVEPPMRLSVPFPAAPILEAPPLEPSTNARLLPPAELESAPPSVLPPAPTLTREPLPPLAEASGAMRTEALETVFRQPPEALLPEPPRGVRPLPPDAAPQDPTCRMEGARGSFSGTLSIDGDRREHSGTHNGDRVIQTYLDDLRLCMRIHGDVEMSANRDEVQSIGPDGWVVLESEEDDLHRLVVTDGALGLDFDWYVNGGSADFDAQGREWMQRVLAVLGGRWEISSIRGEVAGLRGRIAGYRGEVAAMRGEMARHHGEVAGIRGGIASERGVMAAMHGEIAELRGQIAEINARMRNASDDDTRRRLRTLAEEVERAIAEIRTGEEAERRNRHIAELEAQIAEYDLDARLAEVEGRLSNYDLDARVEAVEREIEAVDADRRIAEIERRLRPEVEALQRLLGRM